MASSDLLPDGMPVANGVGAPPSTEGNGGLNGGNPQHDILVQDILGLPPEYVSVVPPPSSSSASSSPMHDLGLGSSSVKTEAGAAPVASSDPLYSRATATPEEVRECIRISSQLLSQSQFKHASSILNCA
jgi:hypothetical protein